MPLQEDATLDPFDSEISISEGHVSLARLSDSVRSAHYKLKFLADPVIWEAHRPPKWLANLEWHEYRYRDVQTTKHLREIIGDDTPGIYMFYARPEEAVYTFPRFPLYVGISERPVWQRLGEYLPSCTSKVKKRQHIHRMLKLYYNQLRVAYAQASVEKTELAAAEKTLHGLIYPCYGRRDFPARVKRVQEAFS